MVESEQSWLLGREGEQQEKWVRKLGVDYKRAGKSTISSSTPCNQWLL